MNDIIIEPGHPYFDPILDFILAKHSDLCSASNRKNRNVIWNELLVHYGIIHVAIDQIILNEYKSLLLILEVPNV